MRNSLKRLGEITKGLLSFPAAYYESSVNVKIVFFYNFIYLQILLISLILLWFSIYNKIK